MVSVIVVTDVVIEVVVDGVGVAVVVVTGAAVVVVVVGATVVVDGLGARRWLGDRLGGRRRRRCRGLGRTGPLVSGADDVVAEVVTLVLAGAEDPEPVNFTTA